jgi:hypothetical protein
LQPKLLLFELTEHVTCSSAAAVIQCSSMHAGMHRAKLALAILGVNLCKVPLVMMMALMLWLNW